MSFTSALHRHSTFVFTWNSDQFLSAGMDYGFEAAASPQLLAGVVNVIAQSPYGNMQRSRHIIGAFSLREQREHTTLLVGEE